MKTYIAKPVTTVEQTIGVELRSVDTVLVQLQLRNRMDVPDGILEAPQRNWEQRRELEQRPERVAGTCVIDNLDWVQLAMLRTGLAANRFRLSDLHFYQDVQCDGSVKWVVVVAFDCRLAHSIEPTDDTRRGINGLAKMTFSFCRAYHNPDRTVAIRMVGLQLTGRPKHAIVTRDGYLRAVRVIELINEAGE